MQTFTANLPTGIKFIINIGYAEFEQPLRLPHILKHSSGSEHPTVFLYNTRLIIPGIT
jgi:hypothetical protein